MTNDSITAGGRDSSCSPVSCSITIVLCTFPDLERARKISREIVSRKLAACANIVPSIESIYSWKGELQSEAEVLVIFKILSEKFPDFEKTMISLHPYDVPEIVGISAADIEARYAQWVRNSCT
ncbi:divalent-cation tolerance protein CutA [Luteolibacter algae]|uniref:Divalent-cation tolerance protein CutA n=1 Tax=Luteolibacter algae TaxID=454151 RepID=A0ABW5D576_9BACT